MKSMRTCGGDRPVLLSEYGVCSGQDFARFVRNFEQLGLEHTADAHLYQAEWGWFLSEWEKLHLEQCWRGRRITSATASGPKAKLALDDYNTWMSNPNLVGDFTSTQIIDAWYHGCGLTNYFREAKPGMMDAFQDMASRVRLCLFVEPVSIYRGTKVRFEAVLVDRDALRPGKYPLRIQVVGPDLKRIFDKQISVEVPETRGKAERRLRAAWCSTRNSPSRVLRASAGSWPPSNAARRRAGETWSSTWPIPRTVPPSRAKSCCGETIKNWPVG